MNHIIINNFNFQEMKKHYLLISAAALCFAAVSCDKSNPEGDNKDKTQEVNLSIFSPDDLEEFDLDWEHQDETLAFEWESDNSEAEYSIAFSLDDTMKQPQLIKAGSECKYDVTHKQFDDILGELGIGEYRKGTLYWQIQAEVNGRVSTSDVRSMDLFRFYKPFYDSVNDQTYKVCRVMDELTGEYAVWMAENLRSTKYSDGTEIGSEGVRFYGDNPDDGDRTDMREIYGGYYTWTAAVRNVPDAEEGIKVQGAAPAGWHIATKDEWDFLINNCTDQDEPATALKNPDYWDPTSGNKGQNTIGFGMPAGGYIWEPLTNSIDDETAIAYYWTATAPKEGDVYPWNPPVSDYPTQGVTYGFAKDDHGAALYPYNRGRGFNVRCVLD